jgi:hypothetical protein
MKKIFLTFSILIATFFGTATFAYAQTTGNTHNGNFFSNLITSIAQKFGLDQNQVQTVANQVKSQNQAQRQQNFQNRENTRLDKLVQQGKITSAQEQQIKDELAKLQSEYPISSFKGMTADQRKATMQKMQDEVNAWSTSTGISKQYLLPIPGIGMRFKMGMRKGWFRTNPTPTPGA